MTPAIVHPVRVGDDLSRGTAAGRGWRRTSWGSYVPAAVDRDVVDQRIAEEAGRLPRSAAVTGWAACRLAGAAFLDGLAPDGRTPLPVPLAVGHRGGVRRHDGITVSFERLPRWEVWWRHGVPVTRPERALFDEMRARSARGALVALDSALAGRITSLARMRAYARKHRSARRFDRVAWALPRGSEHVRSPYEVRCRILAEEDAGYPRLLVNPVLLGADGRRLGEVDLLDEAAGVVIEFDGAEHRETHQQSWDITKDEALRQAGLEVARVTGSQLRDWATMVARLRATRERARWAAPEDRLWSIAPRTFDLEPWLQEQELMAMWHGWVPRAVGW